MGEMNTYMVLGGFLIMLICQDVIAVKAFKKSAREGLLCAIVPGYALYYESREENKQMEPLLGWLVGFGIVLLGIVR